MRHCKSLNAYKYSCFLHTEVTTVEHIYAHIHKQHIEITGVQTELCTLYLALIED